MPPVFCGRLTFRYGRETMRNAKNGSPHLRSCQAQVFYRSSSLYLIANLLLVASMCLPRWGKASPAAESSAKTESAAPHQQKSSGDQNSAPKRAIRIVPFGPAREAPKPNATSQGVVEYWGGPV